MNDIYNYIFSGTDIDITHKLEASKVKQKYLKHTGKLTKNCENHSGNYYINVCELHPSKPGIKSHFQKIMNYLGKHDCVSTKICLISEIFREYLVYYRYVVTLGGP